MSPHRPTLDRDSASRMLQGLVHPDDAPPGYASVAGLLSGAAQLPPLDGDAGAATIPAMVEAIGAGVPVFAPETSGRKSMIGRFFAGKALAAMATVALTASGAAAATGSLPAPVQDAVSGAVSHVGLDLPAKGGKSAEHRRDGEHRQRGGKDNSDDKGQPGEDHGNPAGDDAGSGGNNGKGAEISGLTHDPALDGRPRGPVVSGVASDGKSQAGEYGRPAGGISTAPEGEGGKRRAEERGDPGLEPRGKGRGTGEDG